MKADIYTREPAATKECCQFDISTTWAPSSSPFHARFPHHPFFVSYHLIYILSLACFFFVFILPPLNLFHVLSQTSTLILSLRRIKDIKASPSEKWQQLNWKSPGLLWRTTWFVTRRLLLLPKVVLMWPPVYHGCLQLQSSPLFLLIMVFFLTYSSIFPMIEDIYEEN